MAVGLDCSSLISDYVAILKEQFTMNSIQNIGVKINVFQFRVIHRWGLASFLLVVYNVNQVGKGGKSVNK